MIIEITKTCSVCGGSGLNPNRLLKDEKVKCNACKGSGKITKRQEILSFKIIENKPKQVIANTLWHTDFSRITDYKII